VFARGHSGANERLGLLIDKAARWNPFACSLTAINQRTTKFAFSSAVFSDNLTVKREIMTALAVALGSALHGLPHPLVGLRGDGGEIFLARYRAEVRWINAKLVSADVIDLFAVRDRANKGLVSKSVSANALRMFLTRVNSKRPIVWVRAAGPMPAGRNAVMHDLCKKALYRRARRAAWRFILTNVGRHHQAGLARCSTAAKLDAIGFNPGSPPAGEVESLAGGEGCARFW